MATADRMAVESGIAGRELMENAGRAVADYASERFGEARRILVVCGVGNNGGDGFVAARHLYERGRTVGVFIMGERSAIGGDAKWALDNLPGKLIRYRCDPLSRYDLVIDGLFGAGLGRDIEGEYAALVTGLNDSGVPILAIDLPSGIDGATGAVRGVAINAAATVTFFRLKPGHLLFPGRAHCGERYCVDIGIPAGVLKAIPTTGFHNCVALWKSDLPRPRTDGHKYDRGHVLAVSGGLAHTGAARLLARAALRAGAGLVTLSSPAAALIVNAAHLTEVMLERADTPKELAAILADQRFNTVALGPGLPPDEATRELVQTVLGENRRTVLDAGALTAFEGRAAELFEAITANSEPVVLTPHGGEFARLFPVFAGASNDRCSKADRALAAARNSGAVIVAKGADSVVAAPDGRHAIADNAPAFLATAGSGDTLAGIIAGLLAQGMPAFSAAAAAVWLHGDAAKRIGPGLIAGDLDAGLFLAVNDLLSGEPL